MRAIRMSPALTIVHVSEGVAFAGVLRSLGSSAIVSTSWIGAVAIGGAGVGAVNPLFRCATGVTICRGAWPGRRGVALAQSICQVSPSSVDVVMVLRREPC